MTEPETNPFSSPTAVDSSSDAAGLHLADISMWSWLWRTTLRGAVSGAIGWISLSVGLTFAVMMIQNDSLEWLSDRRAVLEFLAGVVGMSASIGFVVGGVLGLMIGLLSFSVRKRSARRRITLAMSLLLPPALLLSPFLFSTENEGFPIPGRVLAGAVFFVAIAIGVRIFVLIDGKFFTKGEELSADNLAEKGAA